MVARVRLSDILGPGDRAAVIDLHRGPDQDQYLDSMEEIFARPMRSSARCRARGQCTTPRPALVGFAMISDNIPQPIDEDLVGPYYLWKLLIDHRFQRHGYGAATLDAVVDYLATRPAADVLYTSCVDGPGSPRGFYLRYGFTDTGRVMRGESVLALDLAERGRPAWKT